MGHLISFSGLFVCFLFFFVFFFCKKPDTFLTSVRVRNAGCTTGWGEEEVVVVGNAH